jgi:molybdenum cofactor synthesis domain-containing protein
VLVFSDSVAAGKNLDRSGRRIVERLEEYRVTVADYCVQDDDLDGAAKKLVEYADRLALDLVLTTGGTGFGPRDNAPEALARVIDREAPGIAEAIRAHGRTFTPFAMLSRARSGLRGKTLIVNLPGSLRAVEESLDALFPAVFHAFPMIQGKGHDEDHTK